MVKYNWVRSFALLMVSTKFSDGEYITSGCSSAYKSGYYNLGVGESMTIQNPEYPNGMSFSTTYLDCQWVINAPQGYQVHAEAVGSQSVGYHYIGLYDHPGQLSQNYVRCHGYGTSGCSATSTNGSLLVATMYLANGDFFSLRVTVVPTSSAAAPVGSGESETSCQCHDGDFELAAGESKVITSPGYPGVFGSDYYCPCLWLIRAKPGATLSVRVGVLFSHYYNFAQIFNANPTSSGYHFQQTASCLNSPNSCNTGSYFSTLAIAHTGFLTDETFSATVTATANHCVSDHCGQAAVSCTVVGQSFQCACSAEAVYQRPPMGEPCLTACGLAGGNPCENGGTCVNHGSHDLTCVCAVGFTGHFCESNYPITSNCQGFADAGYKNDGVYTFVLGSDTYEAYCEFLDGTGWTAIQRQVGDGTNFNRVWAEYKAGFGQANGSYWLGNDRIARLTANDTALRVKLTSHCNGSEPNGPRDGWAQYGYFKVGPESSNYAMTVSGPFSGTIGDAIGLQRTQLSQNGCAFTTIDRNNDKFPFISCAKFFTGGWWFSQCGDGNLNGVAYSSCPTRQDAIYWATWELNSGLKPSTSLMAIAPVQ